jgi:hypothetical protein
VGTELAEAVIEQVSDQVFHAQADGCATYWASSQVTIGDKPIFHMRVKKASAVKISGAIMYSYSSKKSTKELV